MSDSGGLKEALRRVQAAAPLTVRGRVSALTGLVLRATLPGGRVGDRVRVLCGEDHNGPVLEAQLVGFAGEEVILMPYGEPLGVGPDSLVEIIDRQQLVRCSESMLGRVLDGLGEPMDGRGPLTSGQPCLVTRGAPPPLSRPRIAAALSFGVRAIDGLLTVGKGQRVGLFAGSGVGKSTLLGQIARNAAADVCVVCLVGERGRELVEFIDESLGTEGLARSVVVCATSDAPPLVRLRSAQVATAVAEYFRDLGLSVLLLMDSVTRYARALREVGLATGEPPARRGYPPSVFAELPRLLERTGTAERGSITALYTVLVEGGDMEEPIADEVRGILDGHIVLNRELGQRGHWPAIDVLASLSRVMGSVVSPEHRGAASALRGHLAAFEEKRDLILLGAYKKGSDPRIDAAIDKIGAIEAFLRQGSTDSTPFSETVERLIQLAG